MATDFEGLANEDFCYLTTTGRVSGRPHTIEIWFALAGNTLYMLAGDRERSDWVKNTQRLPLVQVKIGEQVFEGRARVIEEGGEEDVRARKLVLDKYTPRDSDDLTDWSRTALPVAVDITFGLLGAT